MDARRVVLLDGGMGHLLKRMGVTIEGPVGALQRFLGVATANTSDPDLVTRAHLAFIDAGSEVITTNSYSVVPACLQQSDGYPSDPAKQDALLKDLLSAAGRAAVAAREARPSRDVKIAGCLPPLHESYRPDLVGEYEENVTVYRKIVAAIAPFSDVLLCETMSTAMEALAAATAAVEAGLPVSWTLDEGTDEDAQKGVFPVLRSGEPLADAFAALEPVMATDQLAAVMVNCSTPEVTSRAVLLLRELAPASVRVGGYANGFITAKSGSGEYRKDLSPDEYWKQYARDWAIVHQTTSEINIAKVAIGGCCGIFPEHIEAMRKGIDGLTSQ